MTSSNNLQFAPTTPDTSLIEITDSTFENLNFGKVIKTISLVNNKLYPITGLSYSSDAKYPAFDNHGAALNLQGFPGGVDISNSTFVKNMAFVPDVYPRKEEPNQEYENINSYNNSLTG